LVFVLAGWGGLLTCFWAAPAQNRIKIVSVYQ
jgi:hypothetical protein